MTSRQERRMRECPWLQGRFKRGLLDLATANPQLRAPHHPGDRHGALPYPLADSPGLVDFLNAQLSGDPGWHSIIP